MVLAVITPHIFTIIIYRVNLIGITINPCLIVDMTRTTLLASPRIRTVIRDGGLYHVRLQSEESAVSVSQFFECSVHSCRYERRSNRLIAPSVLLGSGGQRFCRLVRTELRFGRYNQRLGRRCRNLRVGCRFRLLGKFFGNRFCIRLPGFGQSPGLLLRLQVVDLLL